jgi:hypothetical protein
MGLLDEAIRDHLDLKRRRGADPGEIAREEQEALEPVFPDEPRPAALDGEPQATMLDEAPPHGDPLAHTGTPTDGPLVEASPEAVESDVSAIGQETAELDMQAVLEQDARLAEQKQHVPIEDSSNAGGAGDDELGWEMPARSADPPPEPLPGQERLSFE